MIDSKELYQALTNIRNNSPLIHNITNMVVMNTTANMLLAVGASPLMAHAAEELNEIIAISSALVINIGTLDKSMIQSFAYAQQLANKKGVPVILDPVGSGASSLRTEAAKYLLENGVNIIRGNASEILSLYDDSVKTKGVDSLDKTQAAEQAAREISKQHQCCVVVSGEEDLVCENDNLIYLRHGDPLLTRVTGMGCSATALIGAFRSVCDSNFLAASYAMLSLGIAAEKAKTLSNGPGSFYPALLDSLYQLSEEDFQSIKMHKQSLCLA